MKVVRIEQRGTVAVVRFDFGVTNAVGNDLVNDLTKALAEVEKGATGMVLTGGDKFFTIGLNLPELLQLSRADMTDFWQRFMQVSFDLYALPLVTIAAVTGHAPAAGTVFALSCDFRLIAEGRKIMGLNEIQLGIPVPYLPNLILRQVAGDRVATRLTYHGTMITPEEALQMGLVDEVHPQEAVLEKAIAKAEEIAAYPSEAFRVIKAARTEEIRRRYHEHGQRQHDDFLTCWYAEPTQQLLAAAAEKF
jgi:enoyl-CoA hydratase/carnithine racemase